MNRIKRFIKGEEGVTAIEYALIAALFAVAIITSLELL
ncbi:MAG: Flp family type IVb pilin [Myxococcota bacterium]